MGDVLEKLIGFSLVLLLPFVIVGGGVFTLFAVGALFEAADHPHELRGRIDGLFRRPPPEARLAGPEHYYRPYWSGRG
jgi:hypothetical protein